DAVVDFSPRLAAITGAPQVRIHVVDAHGVGRRVGGLRVEMTGFDVENARPRLDGGGGHVGPLGSAVRRHLYLTVVSTRPQDVDVTRRSGERSDAARSRGFDAARILSRGGGRLPGLAGEVGA